MLQSHVNKILPEVIQLRHAIHQNPELLYDVHQTADLVVRTLKSFGYEQIQTGIGQSGVVALLDSGKPGKTVGLRADMDALPIIEQTNAAYQSKNHGKMHACGHDGHTATLLGSAYVLRQMLPHFTGKIKLIFQPAEEGGAGAHAMIQDGVLKNPDVDAIFGYHNWPTKRAGLVCVRNGCLLAAADEFTLTIHGKGGHASQPHLTIDPIYISACIIMQMQSIVSRMSLSTEPVVISATQLNAGTAYNVIPSEAQIRGTIRTTNPTTRLRVHQQLEELAQAIASGYGGSTSYHAPEGYPPTMNHVQETDLVRQTARELFGEQGLHELEAPIMGAEDFSYFLQAIPGCYFLVGNGEHTEMCHHPKFNYNDEILPNAMLMMCQTALNYLNKGVQ
jgi:hippurate hydrolase